MDKSQALARFSQMRGSIALPTRRGFIAAAGAAALAAGVAGTALADTVGSTSTGTTGTTATSASTGMTFTGNEGMTLGERLAKKVVE